MSNDEKNLRATIEAMLDRPIRAAMAIDCVPLIVIGVNVEFLSDPNAGPPNYTALPVLDGMKPLTIARIMAQLAMAIKDGGAVQQDIPVGGSDKCPCEKCVARRVAEAGGPPGAPPAPPPIEEIVIVRLDRKGVH